MYHALKGPYPVLPIFIFDTEILQELPEDDARLSFIHETLQQMRNRLREDHGSSIALYSGRPVAVFKKLLGEFDIKCVYTNHDYEPYARGRDSEIASLLEANGIDFQTYKDQVVFEKDEVVKDDGDPYVVYTPYMKKWKATLEAKGTPGIYHSIEHLDHLIPHSRLPNLALSDLGFKTSSIKVPGPNLTPGLIQDYEKTRNYPAAEGTSRLGPHLRFGTISIRNILEKAREARNETFWNELVWREFFMQILWHYPETTHRAFRKKYDRIQWRNKPAEFEKWKAGLTGYALVDAGMRQLNSTGYMHNRVRMLVASFLCKHLLIDWRWGEAYFAKKLLDYELSSNVGNWQWAAGSGVDAAPYFRIFNPMTQVAKFDKDLTYIRKWVPEFDTREYPGKMVDHKEARERCLTTYKAALD